MDLSRRRDLMGTKVEPEELYPVGTEILSMYIGDKDNGARRNFKTNHKIDTSNGEYIEASGYYASPVYIPVNHRYTYQKKNARLNTWAFYDKDKNFLRAGPSYNNLNVQTLAKFPKGVCYVRIQAFNYANQNLEITRTV